MAIITRKIGLSLGADVDWPICFEDIVSRLDLKVPIEGDTIRFEVERVPIEPFRLHGAVDYDVLLDRLTHWYHPMREWIKKATLLDGLYVLNNPWSIQSMEKHTSYCAMLRLGLPIPETWMVPPKEYEDSPDLESTLARYAKLFDVGYIGGELGYPCFMKPYDGGGWRGVNKIDDEDALRKAYEESGKLVMHVQKGVVPFEHFIRCVGLGPQVRAIGYDPDQPLHERYRKAADYLTADQLEELRQITLTINSFFGWDFNSCESLLKDDVWHPIDFANPCPDSQVTSLHMHFPWLIKAKIRWALYCAATKRAFRHNLNWAPYFEIAEEDVPYREKLARYCALADEHFETERFDEFCETHLPHLDEVAWQYFGEDRAKQAMRRKVEALFPDHEWDEFTDHFWHRVQNWRDEDAARRAPTTTRES